MHWGMFENGWQAGVRREHCDPAPGGSSDDNRRFVRVSSRKRSGPRPAQRSSVPCAWQNSVFSAPNVADALCAPLSMLHADMTGLTSVVRGR
jgi:hypothetical protein